MFDTIRAAASQKVTTAAMTLIEQEDGNMSSEEAAALRLLSSLPRHEWSLLRAALVSCGQYGVIECVEEKRIQDDE